MKNSPGSFSRETPNSGRRCVVAGFYGLGGARAGDNPYLQELVRKAGGRMFHFWQQHSALSYLSQEAATDKEVIIYGYSLGGRTAVGVTNALARRGVSVNLLATFDPYCFSDCSTLRLRHDNFVKCVNFYQRNARTGPRFGWWGANPYWGSQVVSPHANVVQIDLTGASSTEGAAVTHLNIVRCAHEYGGSNVLEMPTQNRAL